MTASATVATAAMPAVVLALRGYLGHWTKSKEKRQGQKCRRTKCKCVAKHLEPSSTGQPELRVAVEGGTGRGRAAPFILRMSLEGRYKLSWNLQGDVRTMSPNLFPPIVSFLLCLAF
jgi:hypothetical protein